MGESNQILLGVGIVFVPAIIALLVWIFRHQFGLFRRTVRWDSPLQYKSSYKFSTSNNGNGKRAHWGSIRLLIPRGVEPVKCLKIQLDEVILACDISPKVTEVKLIPRDGTSLIEIPSIESGRYIINVVSIGYGGTIVQGVQAENARCVEANAKKFTYDSWWEIPFWMLLAFGAINYAILLIFDSFSWLSK